MFHSANKFDSLTADRCLSFLFANHPRQLAVMLGDKFDPDERCSRSEMLLNLGMLFTSSSTLKFPSSFMEMELCDLEAFHMAIAFLLNQRSRFEADSLEIVTRNS